MKFDGLLCFILACLNYLGANIYSQEISETQTIDVLSYELILDVDIDKERFHGNVNINFLISSGVMEVTFDCGSLEIKKVSGKNVSNYVQKNNKVIVSLKDGGIRENHIKIAYNGSSSHGIIFNPKKQEVYTVFSTSQWMVCNDSPRDRAKFKIDLSIPKDKQCVASGVLANKSDNSNKTQYSWVQDYESPSYTYGFAIGFFNKFQANHEKITLDYYATSYTSAQLKTIFKKTGEIIEFFETKTGVPYIQSLYSQILMGNHYQEMSGFAVLKESYGNLVLKDRTETNLISHELAHQWWGNMITCENWNHFWLNEGIATFMSAAFNEHIFGKDEYESDIASYQKVYETIHAKGKDKALVFDNWSNPTREDRNLVYFKGAYVIHLLRMKLGEKDFWDGIKFYSQEYFGKSVNTIDFQKAMEEATRQNLDEFFAAWIYEKKRSN